MVKKIISCLLTAVLILSISLVAVCAESQDGYEPYTLYFDCPDGFLFDGNIYCRCIHGNDNFYTVPVYLGKHLYDSLYKFEFPAKKDCYYLYFSNKNEFDPEIDYTKDRTLITMYINPPDWDESLPEGYDTINGLVIADMEYSDGLSSWENPHYILNDWMTLENWERKNSFKKLVGANSEELHYNELYKHTAKIGNTSINDYTVVQSYGETETVPSYAKLGDYVAISDNSCSPYAPGYYVYKENEKSIYTLREAWENNFVDLEDIFNNTNILRLIGDTNNDKRVDIIDVTNIQKHLAKKEQLKNDMCVGNSDNADNLTVYFSDFDGNGITNIRDVSKIQKKLAKMI